MQFTIQYLFFWSEEIIQLFFVYFHIVTQNCHRPDGVSKDELQLCHLTQCRQDIGLWHWVNCIHQANMF